MTQLADPVSQSPSGEPEIGHVVHWIGGAPARPDARVTFSTRRPAG
jgi:hypothetical protein